MLLLHVAYYYYCGLSLVNMQHLCFTVTRVHASAIAAKHRRHACPPLSFAAALSLLLLQLFGHHTVSVTPQLPITCLGNLTATQQREGHDLTSPTGPWYIKDLFISFYPADTAEQVGGLERRRGTSMEVSFFWNLANKEHLIHLCPAIHKEHSMWFANTKHYWAFCFANRGRTDETNTLCCRNKYSTFYTCQENYFFSDLYKSFKDGSQNIFPIKKGGGNLSSTNKISFKCKLKKTTSQVPIKYTNTA